MRVSRTLRMLVLLASASCAADPVALTPGSAVAGGSGSGGAGIGGSGAGLGFAGSAGTLVIAPPTVELGAECDATRSIAGDSASLVVRDPEVLERFGLERVLRQIASTADADIEPLELLQRLFDTDNADQGGVFADGVHCDSPQNPAFRGSKPVDCPRAEGRLAASADLLSSDAADGFVPVAIVNRFDLLPSDFSSCGEQRIVYAKRSGRTDADDRVFLSFEAALFNSQQSLVTCRRIAELWAGLASATPAARADQLEQFFFLGVGGFGPVVHAAQYGLGGGDCFYSGACGQVRVAQGMQAPWQFRQFRPARSDATAPGPALYFSPTTDSGALRPDLFESAGPEGSDFRGRFLSDIDQLVATDVNQIRLRTHEGSEAGESSVAGPAAPNFAVRVQSAPDALAFNDSLAAVATRFQTVCPNDALTPADLLQRAALSCAGCHAPEQALTEGRKLGCGDVWPKSLGQTHIDEQGELSPALREGFLPYRASVLTTFLQACDSAAILANLQPVPEIVHAECFPAGTPITLPSGETRAIESVGTGDWVLSYEQSTQSLVPAQVVRRIVRPTAASFVRINGGLLATDNHPFYADGAWVRADSLQVGANLLFARDVDATAKARSRSSRRASPSSSPVLAPSRLTTWKSRCSTATSPAASWSTTDLERA